VPLWTAAGSGAVSRQILGTTVIGGMLAATFIAIFLIPVLFYVVERFSTRKSKTGPQAPEVEQSAGVAKDV
jgi:HAE1 family hydrophobic/amphiphilic exporter-1